MTTMIHRMGRTKRNRGLLAAAVGTIAVVAIVLGLTLGGGDDDAAVSGLTPLAPDSGTATPGEVQTEPGDTAAPTDATPSSLDGPSAIAAVGPGLSVGEALASTLDQPLLVNGFVVADADGVRLCSVLLESFPVQCGGDRLLVEGLNLESLGDVTEASGVLWTNQPVQLLGPVEDGVLTVSGLTQA